MRRVFPKKINFIAQYNLILLLFKVFEIAHKFPFYKSLLFSGTIYFRQPFSLVLTKMFA